LQLLTAYGQSSKGNSSETGIHWPTDVALSSCSKKTEFADRDISKDRHGLQEYSVPLADGTSGRSLKAEKAALAQCMRVPANETEAGFCSDIKTLPVALKLGSACGANWYSVEFLSST
jgi:hypothetical protein